MFDVKRYARALRIGGYTEEEAKKFIEVLAENNGYGINSQQALLQMETVYRADRQKTLAQQITDWIVFTQGWWGTKMLDQDLQIATQVDRGNRRVILHRLVEAGVLERDPKKNGIFRRFETDLTDVDWKDADPENVLRVRFPFNLEELMEVFPGTVAIIAGTKNSGKSAFANNFIKLNMNDPNLPQPIHLFTSEGVAEELHDRFAAFGLPLDDWTHKTHPRHGNFGDVIQKDRINVIDYLEQRGGEYFLVRDELSKITENLGKGFALVCIQKPPGRDYALGGSATAEACRLYVSIDTHKMKIVHAKKPIKGKPNPSGWIFTFDCPEGAEFQNIKRDIFSEEV